MSDRPLEDVLWEPPHERAAGSAMAAFAQESGLPPRDYEALHAWSVAEPEAFHRRLWDALGIIGDRGERIVVPDADIRNVRFFPDARLNYAENLLRSPDDRPAIIAHREDGIRRTVTRRELYDLVACCVQALRAEGVREGDCVAGLLTNDLEAIAVHLAAAAIGAVWSSCSPEFGPAGAADRLGQLEPAVLVAVPRYRYGGKLHEAGNSIEAVAAAGQPRRIILIEADENDLRKHAGSMSFEHWIGRFDPAPIHFVRLPFDAPLVVLFSSGTTGRPKCIVHGAGRILLAHLKEHRLHCDVRAGERLFYFTTCSWMMWNWLVSGLASEATLVTYDGNPAWPGRSRMFELIEQERIDIFGTSAKFIDELRKAGQRPSVAHDLSSLRTVLSTGSPLAPECFTHVYEDWKADVHLASISGGTDICGCFLGGVPLRPVRAGELQGPMLGMDIAVFSPEGEPVQGAAGELVCRNAHLSMPLGFLGDSDGARYTASYFQRFPGVWAHGDFVVARPSGGYIIHGRSDTTLNPGGVRIGTAEIYRTLAAFGEIVDSVAVGQSWQGDQRVVLFVQLAEGYVLDDDLRQRIKARIRADATARHVPSRILQVSAVPRTRTGKISEAAATEVVHGRPLANAGALANPECLAEFGNRPELAS